MSDLPKAPCVGENVVWYPHGNIDMEPFAATVTSRINDECITLYTLSPTGRREPMLNVKHIDHPDHKNNPMGTRRWGAWDFVGEHEKRKKVSDEYKEKQRKKSLELAEENMVVDADYHTNPDDNEMIIIKFARECGDEPGRAVKIADKISAGMTYQRVNAVLRKFPHLLTGNLPEELIEAEV
jgi:hypothetical protein